MSNIKILFSVLFISIIILPIFHLLGKFSNLSMRMYWDLTSIIIVLINTFLIYFGFSNYKNYQNKLINKVKFNFLKETFILMAMCGTLIGLTVVWASVGSSSAELTGESWSRLGLSIGVCFITDSYGILFYFSTYLLENMKNKKRLINEKIINKINSKVYLSLLLFISLIISIGFALFLSLDWGGIHFLTFLNSLNYFPIYLMLLLFILSFLIVGSNFKYIFKSLFNASLEISHINDTLNYIKKLCRIILILIGLIFLSSLVVITFSFAMTEENYIQTWGRYFSNIYFSFFICITYITFLRGFLFRLNIELIEKNQISIDTDNLFLYKYCLPLYISTWITIGFSFLILFFK